MFPKKFMRLDFGAENMSSNYISANSLLVTNPVERHDFDVPLSHKPGINSCILLHAWPDDMERGCIQIGHA